MTRLIILFYVIIFGLIVFIASCATVYPRHPLADQILKPREGFKGLTNRVCLEYNWKSECVREEIKEYLLDDETFRATVNDLRFICSIGGKRFKVCLDKAGFCRYTYEGFFKRRRIETFIPIENYQYLLDSKTVCRKSY